MQMRLEAQKVVRAAAVGMALLVIAGCGWHGEQGAAGQGRGPTNVPQSQARQKRARPVLRLYSGAGLRAAVAELAREFEKRHAVRIECDYGGSNMIFGRLKVAREGDIFIPGAMRYVKMAEDEGLIASYAPACYFIPVILVAKGNPKGIHGLKDLLKPGVKIGLGDEKACAIGRVSRRIFEKNGIDPAEVEKHVAFRSLTVNELGLQITAGQLDAAIVWDATARQYEGKADVVKIPADKNVISVVPVAVLTCSKYPKIAEEFKRFATSKEGKKIWAKHGYTVEPPEGFQERDAGGNLPKAAGEGK